MNLIKEYYKEFTEEMLEESLFVIDNNCLLFPFKDFGNKGIILKAFEKISDKTYIPFITQVEYLNNENNIIKSTENMLGRSEGIVNNLESRSEKIIDSNSIKQLVIDKLFGKSKDVTNVDYMKTFSEKFEELKKDFIKKIEKETENTIQNYNELLQLKMNESLKQFEWGNLKREDYSNNVGDLKVEMTEWFYKVRMGEMYSPQQIDDYNEVIPQRYKERISPGYEDVENKENKFISLGFKKINKSYSDAIFWLDALEHAKQNSKDKKYLIIVSNETKSDWVRDKNAQKINDDMFYECWHHTGLICKKVNIWTLMKVFGDADEQVIEQSQSDFAETEYEFMLYGQNFYPKNQSQMMRMIFETVISRVDGNYFLSIACLQKYENWKENSTFRTIEIIQDKYGEKFVLGLSMKFQDKLRYIYALLETRVAGSSGQLKFKKIENQTQWNQFRIWKK
ncbi:TPA: hypothetical protein U1W10_000309 [Streptococcus suis]|nr:hypothetical protein [Streptococcus suis]